MSDDETIIKHTVNWVQNIIVDFNFCPFAGREVAHNKIRYVVDRASTHQERLHHLINECLHLDNNTATETTLIIFPDGLDKFEDFLDFIHLAEALMEQQGYEGIYQLAHFHPRYQFENTDIDDAANYTNRSPYPMLHLIREASIEQALKTYPHPEAIPERNIELARKNGKLKMQALLDATLKKN